VLYELAAKSGWGFISTFKRQFTKILLIENVVEYLFFGECLESILDLLKIPDVDPYILLWLSRCLVYALETKGKLLQDDALDINPAFSHQKACERDRWGAGINRAFLRDYTTY